MNFEYMARILKLRNEKIFLQSFGSKLRFLREKKKLSLNEVSKKLKSSYSYKISSNMVGKIERGENGISLFLFYIFCDYFDVPSSFFLDENAVDEALYLTENGRELLEFLETYSEKDHLYKLTMDILKNTLPKFEKFVRINQEMQLHEKPSILKAASRKKT